MRTRTTALAVGTVAAVAGSLTALTFLTSSTTASADLAGSPGSGQSVVDWNARLVSILGTAGAQPAAVHPTRSFAMLQAAEYNAVVLVTHAAPAYHSQLNEPGDARPDVAADQAAHDVLVALYPARKTDLDGQLTTELEAVADGTPKSHGVDVGVAVAQQIIALRAADGSGTPAPAFVAGGQPGDYRPTPPKFPAPAYTGWGDVIPFLTDSARQFRPAPPPSVGSTEYAAALAEVRDLGRDTSTTRTADQTVAGTFWSGTPIWITWNQVAQQLTTDRKASLAQATATFAAMDLALADTTIALYSAKYDDHVWRPVTAIQQGCGSADPAMAADPTWNPLTPTAPDPSYPGAHSALSAAAADVLTGSFGTGQALTVTSAAAPGVTRHFATLDAAADEAGLSRIWSGQHTRLDHAAGQQLGRQVADLVLRAVPLPAGPLPAGPLPGGNAY